MRDLFKQGFEALHFRFYQLERLIEVRFKIFIWDFFFWDVAILKIPEFSWVYPAGGEGGRISFGFFWVFLEVLKLR